MKRNIINTWKKSKTKVIKAKNYLVLENKSIEDLVKEFEYKMPKHQLNMNQVKLEDENNFLKQQVFSKDPKKIYSMVDESEIETKLDLVTVEPSLKVPTGLPKVRQIIKYPVLKEDAKVTFKKDPQLKLRAGGYNSQFINLDLYAYAKMGL